jgi:hypothetical protein
MAIRKATIFRNNNGNELIELTRGDDGYWLHFSANGKHGGIHMDATNICGQAMTAAFDSLLEHCGHDVDPPKPPVCDRCGK